MQARLILEDGTIFTGKSFGAQTEHTGEVIFHTGVTGYQELITSPSNAGQIVVMTYPLVGNYGITREDFEVMIPQIQGLIVKSYEAYPSNWRAQHSLEQLLVKHGIPAISNIDTRMLTRKIREYGTMRGIITTSTEASEVLIAKLQQSQQLDAIALIERAATKTMYFNPGQRERVVLLDFGTKKSLLQQLAKRECDVVIVPYDTSAAEIDQLAPDGIVLSDGPGNPEQLLHIVETVKQLLVKYPLFGIGLGHYLFALASGARTEKMKYGHHGGNYPVKQLANNRCYITSQNHNYVVYKDSVQSTDLAISYINNNDGTVEGLQHLNYPAFSVQFQPGAGSHDTLFLFDEFIDMMNNHKQSTKDAMPQAKLLQQLKGALQHASK
ncbi:carbamoyl phosphate synthase small subunit [Paenibacillus yanchengensis]|uniref:Carbamoyl phosphate synthase small chain n=1 Tax=Paenibacillus yanchengensis TaxID=2035833 RepID=A0ABW4YKM8_9BACL